LLYAHDQVFDGQKVIQKIQQQLELPHLLIQPTPYNEPLDHNTQTLISETLINHINYALELFYSSIQEVQISHLWIAGDCAVIPQLAELIQMQIGIPTNAANPTQFLTISPELDSTSFALIAPALTLCCGLALHEGLTS
jgi:type IV pilus assembly protein PilM